MTDTGKGWVMFIAAMGAMLTMMAVEVSNLETWQFVTTPTFVGKAMAHLGTVIGAFIGGRLIPTKE